VALALAAARGLPSVVVEADPYGGDLALRCLIDGDPLPPTPTVLGLGAGRAEGRPTQGLLPEAPSGEMRRLDLWRDGSHRLNDLVRVVPGFLTAEQGMSLSWASVAATVESQLVPVFADLGRVHTGSPSMPIAAAADALITVCRGDVASVQHMIWRLEQLVPAIAERNGRTPLVVPVVVSTGRNGSRAASQVAELLADTGVGPTVRGVGWIAWNPASVTQLQDGGDPWAKPLRNSPLLKSARKVMRLLGLATGLDHTDPSATGKWAWLGRSLDDQTAGRFAVNPGIAAAEHIQPPPIGALENMGAGASVPPAASAPPLPAWAARSEPVDGRAAAGSGPFFEGLRRPWPPARVREED
jgi:hypothetical protein